MGSIPGQGTKILNAKIRGQKMKFKKKKITTHGNLFCLQYSKQFILIHPSVAKKQGIWVPLLCSSSYKDDPSRIYEIKST